MRRTEEFSFRGMASGVESRTHKETLDSEVVAKQEDAEL